MPVIDTKFTLLEMYIERGFMNAPELRHPGLRDGPEVFHFIDMVVSVGGWDLWN